MDNKTIKDLIELNIYNSKPLSKNDYDKLSNNNTDDSLIYITGNYGGANDEYNKFYKEIDTKGLTLDDVKLQLEIDITKNIRAIKSMVTFFVILTIIALIASFLFGISLSDSL